MALMLIWGEMFQELLLVILWVPYQQLKQQQSLGSL